MIIQNAYPFLLVLNDTPNESILKLISSTHGFLLARTSKSALSNPQIIKIANFVVNGVDYSIYRRISKSKPLVVTAKGDNLSIRDLSRKSVSWVNELYNAVDEATTKKTKIFLIAFAIPTEGVRNFVEELLSIPKMSLLRVLFILDKQIVDVNVDNVLLQHVFKSDLTLTVFKDGVLSSMLPVPVKIKDNIPSNLSISNNTINNRVIDYIGINLKDETLLPLNEKKNELGNIDYSGVTTAGQKVMGLAYLDKDECKLIPDSVFSWDVPEGWSLEDAATIPHAYISVSSIYRIFFLILNMEYFQAYYCLFTKARLKVGETVLIHAGCTAIGLAAIKIASSHNCKIYTTVSTDKQRNFLKSHFSFVRLIFSFFCILIFCFS